MSQEEIVHVIDDDEAVRESLSFLLRAAGFGSVRLYTDPADRFALALAR